MTRPWRRRALLRSGAVAIGSIAGCVGGDGNHPDPATTRETTDRVSTTPTETGTPTSERTPTTERPAVELRPVSVQSSFFYHTSTGALDVGAVEGRQFAFVNVRPRTASPPPSDFSLVADGRRFWGSLAPDGIGGPHRLVERGPAYHHDSGDPGWVAFAVPDPLDAAAVSLQYDGRRRPVGDDFRSALRAPPAEFELLGFDVPDRVAPDESVAVSVAVKNAGEGSGTFRACVDVGGESLAPRREEFGVPPGERREWTRTLVHDSDGADPVGVRFESPVADREATVEVTSGTATTGSPSTDERGSSYL